jgi:hypothetical protein
MASDIFQRFNITGRVVVAVVRTDNYVDLTGVFEHIAEVIIGLAGNVNAVVACSVGVRLSYCVIR